MQRQVRLARVLDSSVLMADTQLQSCKGSKGYLAIGSSGQSAGGGEVP